MSRDALPDVVEDAHRAPSKLHAEDEFAGYHGQAFPARRGQLTDVENESEALGPAVS